MNPPWIAYTTCEILLEDLHSGSAADTLSENKVDIIFYISLLSRLDRVPNDYLFPLSPSPLLRDRERDRERQRGTERETQSDTEIPLV